MIDSQTIELLERTLEESRPPDGCTLDVASPVIGFSFWQTLEHLSLNDRLAPSERDSIVALIQNCRGDFERLRSLAKVKPCPVLAVCGLLNSGKSSLVAGFLSDRGRERVLVGLGDEAGTHRFLIWLPEVWRSDEVVWAAALQNIKEVFGNEAEFLSDDPQRARRQYNGLSEDESRNKDRLTTFQTPLVATDPLLDILEVGLMDCPDIQSGIFGPATETRRKEDSSGPNESGGFFQALESVADQRGKTLLKGLRLASGLIVVAQSNMIGERTMQRLIESTRLSLPHIRTFVAINRVPKRYEAREIAEEVRRHFSRYEPQGIYMAYDFRGPDNKRQIPQPPAQWHKLSADQQLPIFFDIVGNSSSISHRAIEAGDYLVNVRDHLDAARLTDELVRSTVHRVITELRDCNKAIESATAAGRKQIDRLYHTFGESIMQFIAVPGKASPSIRLQLSQEIIAQIRESLERTAPWWAKPSQVIGRWSTSVSSSAKDLTKRIPGLPSLGRKFNDSVEWIRTRIRTGEGGSVMTANQLATAIRRSDQWGDLPPSSGEDSDPVLAAASRIIDRFQSESHARLDDRALDQGTKLIWSQMSWKQKLYTGVAPATLVFAPIIAVITVPLDFGTTHVLVFATVKELLLAGVASAGLFLLQSDQFPELAEGQAAWIQVSDLFAITCDEFGCARPAANRLPVLCLDSGPKPLLQSTTAPHVRRSDLPSKALAYQAGFQERFHELLDHLSQIENRFSS